MTDKTFTIVPAPTSTYLTIAGIFLLMLIPFIVLGYSCVHHIRPFSRIFFFELLFIILIIAIGGIFAYFGYSARKTKFVITDEGLRIKGALYGRSIARDSLVMQDVRTINLLEDAGYRPGARTNGVGLPGYKEGWFRLHNKQKALLFLTSNTKVVYLPTNKGYSVLLSVAEPEKFINSLQESQLKD